MKNYRNKLGEDLYLLLEENLEYKLLENRDRVIRRVLANKYPDTVKSIEKDTLLAMIADIVYLDREARNLTEGIQDEVKQRLSQQWQLDNGYVPGHAGDLKKLQTL